MVGIGLAHFFRQRKACAAQPAHQGSYRYAQDSSRLLIAQAIDADKDQGCPLFHREPGHFQSDPGQGGPYGDGMLAILADEFGIGFQRIRKSGAHAAFLVDPGIVYHAIHPAFQRHDPNGCFRFPQKTLTRLLNQIIPSVP